MKYERTPKAGRAYTNSLLRDGIIGVVQQAVLFDLMAAWDADKRAAYRAGIEAAAKKLREIADDRDLTCGEQMLLNDAADIIHILPDQEEKP